LNFKKTILLATFSCLIVWLGYFTPRQAFGQLFGLYSALFIVYFLLVKYIKDSRVILITAIFFRLLLLFSIPALSDDFYRFVWDGRLLLNDINPYTILPSDFIQTPDFQRVIIDKSIFTKLNSPNYYTVYPPLNQLIFVVSAWFSQGSLFGNVLSLRVFILLAEIGTLFLLGSLTPAFKKERTTINTKLALYAFNPLIILELTGNLHFEAVVIFFLLLAYQFRKKSIVFSSLFFACAVSTKMLPLIFIPLIIKFLGIKKGIFYAFLVDIFTLVLFVPFLDKMLIEKLFSSVNLYFQKFEFNASIYYLIRAIGFQFTGYNIIGTAGKILALLTFSGVFLISWKSKSFFLGALAILTLYFSVATTVHPWYAANLVAIAVFTQFRYPIVWSYTIFLSYATYQTNLYQENLWLVALEYLLVLGVMIYEIYNRRVKKPSY
jgi:alpha-1,6-mannosyltransferase